MKKILLFIFAFAFFGFFGVKVASAQVSDDPAQKYGITFPIAELGNCTDLASCKTYCDDPLTVQSCINFAKSKGFYKDSQTNPDDTVIQKAKESLGCDSITSCKAFCDQATNYDKCHSFAQNTGLAGGYREDPTKTTILAKAEEALGCSSYDTCKSFCDNPINYDKCAQFARSVNLIGGYEYKGPGGCTSAESCATFCKDPGNVDVCKQFSQSTTGQSSYDPQTECKKYPSCSWSGTYCQCSQNDSGSVERQKTQCVSYPGCLWTGTTCQCGTSGGAPYPTSSTSGSNLSHDQQEAYCKTGGGVCDWTTGVCNCKGYHSTSTPYPTTYSGSGSTMSREQQEATCNSGGGTCTWNNDTCNCQGYHTSGSSQPSQSSPPSQPDPAAQCASYPGCSWNGSMCQCSSSGVQGVHTVVTWFQEFVFNIENLLGK